MEQEVGFTTPLESPILDSIRELPSYSESAAKENLTFAAYSDTSAAAAVTFTDETNVVVSWGAAQSNKGPLTVTTDYTIVDSNKIKLVEPKWTSTIEANSLGLLNVDVLQA